MTARMFFRIFCYLLSAFISISAEANVITSDTIWEGEVLVEEDIVVPKGITLTVKPGTVIKVVPSESTKTDPEYMSPLTEITVRGVLRTEGTEALPVSFTVKDEKPEAGLYADSDGGAHVWAGIIIDGGSAYLKSCKINGAETGVYLIKGILEIKDSVLRNNRYGVVMQAEKTKVSMKGTIVNENEYGLFYLGDVKADTAGNTIKGNSKKDIYIHKVRDNGYVKEYKSGKKELSRRYRDEVLLGDMVWQGRIEINGIIRVPEGSRLIIMPGSVIEFRKKDTNSDGIGENGFLVQGVLIAKGTPENPIIFRSAEKQKDIGDWDSINIMNSDGAQNLIEYCQIEDAYRGLHFHFSNVAVKGAVLRNNYRGVQFQESAVEISGSFFYKNKSGIQARDSEIVLVNNNVSNNQYGANFFRSKFTARGNKILGNIREGLRIREGVPVVEENLFAGNRYGLMVSDSVYGNFKRNIISGNSETGVSLKATDNIDISGNYIQGNGISGITIKDSRAVIKGNQISDNGERGIGIISFEGVITENNILKNGACDIDLEGNTDINAQGNWFGSTNPKQTICDKDDNPARGSVRYSPVKENPLMFAWPLKEVSADTLWRGSIVLPDSVVVNSGVSLLIAPGAKVLFSKGAGLKVNGKIKAVGQKDARIIFTSISKEDASDWDELLLEHATDSMFSNCDFEYATWGIHSHFTNLKVDGCRFRNNYGGLRFRSGPAEIKRSLFSGNTIGIRAYIGNAVILENNITGNETGIFVREKGSGLTIKKNNIHENRDYNIRVGDFNDEDVDARGNYWGREAPESMIFDGRKEAGIGKVIYEPYLREPVNTGGVIK